jgi:hypothetical protein
MTVSTESGSDLVLDHARVATLEEEDLFVEFAAAGRHFRDTPPQNLAAYKNERAPRTRSLPLPVLTVMRIRCLISQVSLSHLLIVRQTKILC